MDDKSIRSAIGGLLKTGSSVEKSPSEDILKSLDDHLAEGDLRGFAATFRALAETRRPNVGYVESRVPAKILNQYLLHQPGITSQQTRALASHHPMWAQELKDALRSSPRFEKHVAALADQVRAL